MQTTDEMLDYLATIGRPRVSRQKDGAWFATLEFPAPRGVSAEVSSDFSHPTHRDALHCVIRRLDDMRGMLSVDAKPLPRTSDDGR